MGKYINKLKGTGVEATTEVNHEETSIGVRTRSKTLALRHSHVLSLPSFVASAVVVGIGGEGGPYLQLRSRRLARLPPGGTKGKGQKQRKKYSNSKSKGKRPTGEKGENEKKLEKDSVLDENEEGKEKGPMLEENEEGKEKGPMHEEYENEKKNISIDDLEIVEASCEENMLEIESKERASRETTPSNMMIPDPETMTPPCSSTRRSYRSNIIRTVNFPMQFNYFPVTDEMNQSFAAVEEKERNKFIEKYNFDPVKDEPLPGRFEWEKLKP